MVRKQHKLLALLLCLLVAVSALASGMASVTAASGDVVYVRANNTWTNLYCYMWNGTGETKNADWPGVKMTSLGNNVYSYTLNGSYQYVIFNNGSGGGDNQTTDLNYPGTTNMIYDLKDKTWSQYTDAPQGTTSASNTQAATQSATQAATASVTGNIVYLNNTAGWSSPKVYMWSNSGNPSNASWPGVSMTRVSGNIWMYNAPQQFANCVFSDNGSSQTSDLTAKYGYIYDNTTKGWELYDPSPIQITSFTTDPDATAYVGTEITLAAEAISSGGTVYYKFSVKNSSGGESVVANFSTAKSATWTPTATGTYTITYAFRDAQGNENSRTKTISIESDANLVKPVIKAVSPQNLNLIAVNTPATVRVTAGGGKTGTNLLFYKYIVTDPNGVKNTPYYTLNSTYNFTPSMAGSYTVNVFVQNSDNTTVSKTYTYTATNGSIPTPTDPPVPPTTQPSSNVWGDVDGDGYLTILDATYIQKYLVHLRGATTINVATADVDGDGVVSIIDATYIQKKLAHLM